MAIGMTDDDGSDSIRQSVSILLDQYALSLEVSNRSPKTISWYSDILCRYFSYLREHGLLKPVNELGREELRAFIRSRQNAARWPNNPHISADKRGRLSAYTVQGDVRAVKAFRSWLQSEEYTDASHLKGFPLPKVPEKQVIILTTDEFRALLNAIDMTSALGTKRHCMLMFAYDTGVRVSELVGIELSDIDLSQHFVKVVGKGAKERTIPFHGLVGKELRRYVRDSRSRLCSIKSPYLFPGVNDDHESAGSFRQFMRRLADRAGIPQARVFPHILRHSFATAFLANGGSRLALMQILGHSSIQSTKKYMHLQPPDLRRQHMRFSPTNDLFNKKP